MEFMIDLNRVEDVKEFVRIAEMYDSDIIVKSQDKNFSVDASSIMGVFSLNLSNPVIVHISNKEIGESFKEAVDKFII